MPRTLACIILFLWCWCYYIFAFWFSFCCCLLCSSLKSSIPSLFSWGCYNVAPGVCFFSLKDVILRWCICMWAKIILDSPITGVLETTRLLKLWEKGIVNLWSTKIFQNYMSHSLGYPGWSEPLPTESNPGCGGRLWNMFVCTSCGLKAHASTRLKM